jgi:hypothetical protein
MNSLGSALRWRVPIDHLLLYPVSQVKEEIIDKMNFTLWPAFVNVSTTARRPRIMGGCGPTTPSVQ